MGSTLIELLEGVAQEVAPIDVAVVDRALGIARRRRRTKALGVPVAAAVVAMAAVGAVALVNPGPTTRVAGPGRPAQLARQLEGFSFLAADVRTNPAGRAVAAVQDWSPDLGFMDEDPHSMVVGADGNSYRVLTDNTGSGAFSMHSTLLSPDGTLAVIEDVPGLEVQDLRTGSVRHVNTRGPCCGWRLLGLSPDARTAVLRGPGPGVAPGNDQFDENLMTGYLLDMQTSAVTELGSGIARAGAFSPDGKLVAISSNNKVSFFDRAGALVRETKGVGDIGGPNAFSPDGRFIVTVPETRDRSKPRTLTFVPVDPAAPAADAPLPLTVDRYDSVLGWRSATTIAVAQWTGHGTDIVEFDLRTGHGRTLATANGNVESMAAGLLPHLVITQPGNADFGPWPSWFGAVVATFSGVLLLLVVGVRRVRRRRAASAA